MGIGWREVKQKSKLKVVDLSEHWLQVVLIRSMDSALTMGEPVRCGEKRKRTKQKGMVKKEQCHIFNFGFGFGFGSCLGCLVGI